MDDHMEAAMSHVMHLEADQLRALIAHASGLHATKTSITLTAESLRRVAFRLEEQIGQTSTAMILRRVAAIHGLTVEELTSPSRRADICRARFQAAYELRQVRWSDGRIRFSYPHIAKILGGRDHTTILNACRRWVQILAEQERAAA